MSNERIADMRIIPIEFPKLVQLEYRFLDADKKPSGLPYQDPPEKWSELKRRLLMTEADFVAAEPLLRRGEPHPLGIQRVLKP